jgi:hypothetical protein
VQSSVQSAASYDGGSHYGDSNYGQSDLTYQSHESQNESQDQYVQQPPVQQREQFSYNYSQPPAPVPSNHNQSGHNRELSGFGEVMGGGGPDMRSLASGSTDVQIGAGGDDEDVDELRKKAKSATDALREAENVAKDAEDSKKQLMAQADELRRIADEAEKKARDMASNAAGKKKGLLGRGQKKDIVSCESREHLSCFFRLNLTWVCLSSVFF